MKPYTVCHMLTTIDGRIDGAFFGCQETVPARDAFGKLREYYECQATVYGKMTMLTGYADGIVSDLNECSEDIPMQDYINPDGKVTGNYIVALDPEGELSYSSSTSQRKGRAPAHIIAVLTEKAEKSYLAYLQKKGISYLIVGSETIDCTVLLDKLADIFGIRRIMISGGAITNDIFLQNNLIDELSIVIAPTAEGNDSSRGIFSQAENQTIHAPYAFVFKSVKILEGSTVWLRYERTGK